MQPQCQPLCSQSLAGRQHESPASAPHSHAQHRMSGYRALCGLVIQLGVCLLRQNHQPGGYVSIKGRAPATTAAGARP
eukprot:5692930-Prymnesium_polylepis.1